jgi:predicted XRE-type DNA-binding protein
MSTIACSVAPKSAFEPYLGMTARGKVNRRRGLMPYGYEADYRRRFRREGDAMAKREIEFEADCGNIFADLELPDPDELLLKAKLVVEFQRLLDELSLTQTAASRMIGVAQPDLSNLLRGSLRGFSVERIMRMLTALGQNVEIVLQPHGAETKARRIAVGMSRVAAIGYQAAEKTLEIEFVSGEVYRYFKVPEWTYKAFLKADSKGAFFRDRVRGRFPYVRLTSKRASRPRLSAGSPSSARRARSAAGR